VDTMASNPRGRHQIASPELVRLTLSDVFHRPSGGAIFGADLEPGAVHSWLISAVGRPKAWGLDQTAGRRELSGIHRSASSRAQMVLAKDDQEVETLSSH